MELAPEGEARARVAHALRLGTMEELRLICDETEAVVPPELWTLATYKDLLFLDSHYGNADIISGKASSAHPLSVQCACDALPELRF